MRCVQYFNALLTVHYTVICRILLTTCIARYTLKTPSYYAHKMITIWLKPKKELCQQLQLFSLVRCTWRTSFGTKYFILNNELVCTCLDIRVDSRCQLTCAQNISQFSNYYIRQIRCRWLCIRSIYASVCLHAQDNLNFLDNFRWNVAR